MWSIGRLSRDGSDYEHRREATEHEHEVAKVCGSLADWRFVELDVELDVELVLVLVLSAGVFVIDLPGRWTRPLPGTG